MGKISKENLRLLLDDFFKWYENDAHGLSDQDKHDGTNRENAFAEFRKIDFWKSLSDEELLEKLFEFAYCGGNIQGGGPRTAYRFKESNVENKKKLRDSIYYALSEDFELDKWWSMIDEFKFFGKGIRTIFLHRLNPNKFSILNNKSKDGLKKLGYIEKPKSNAKTLYSQIMQSINELLKDSVIEGVNKKPMNFYTADALMHYIIGVPEGIERSNELIGLNDEQELDVTIDEATTKPIKIPSNYAAYDNLARNQIFYGPPGTGKTFNTFEYVKSNILEDEGLQKDDMNNRDDLRFVTFHQSYSYEQFVEGISVLTDKEKPEIVKYEVKDGVFRQACLKAIGSNFKTFKDFMNENKDRESRKEFFKTQEPVVLIIDEINRGNISKIFGELITLIEDDKRLGEENEITVTLPYSGDTFGVPPNLYIIGTMNTADRSLVQLDTALRRRFEFEEMMPKYREDLNKDGKVVWVSFEEKINDTTIDLSKFLYKLNEKITEHYDREHQIGHSFLMNVKDMKELQRAWENKIMPLLQEYFYANLEDLAKVIGQSEYLKKEGNKWKLNMKASEGTIDGKSNFAIQFAIQFAKVFDFVTKAKLDEQELSTN